MRLVPIIVALAMICPAYGQSTARPRPPGTIALDDVPPPPPMVESGVALEPPPVTIQPEASRTVEERRIPGQMNVERVTPKHGHPYVVIDHRPDGQFAKQDNLDVGFRVPQWILLEF